MKLKMGTRVVFNATDYTPGVLGSAKNKRCLGTVIKSDLVMVKVKWDENYIYWPGQREIISKRYIKGPEG